MLFKVPPWVTAQNATEIVEFQKMVNEKVQLFTERNRGMKMLTQEHGDLNTIINSSDIVKNVTEIEMLRAN